jgi:tetratricopeptide (TPR) repeat protein
MVRPDRFNDYRVDPPQARNNLAQALARTGQIPQAIEQFHLAIELDENFAAAHVGLGLVFDAQGKFDDAIKQFKKAIQLGASGADIHNSLGESFRKSGQIDLAIEHYQTAVRIKPDFMPACANLAQTLALANRSPEAIAVSKKSITVARSTDQQEAAQEFEEWLKHYRTELARTNETTPARLPEKGSNQ